MAQNKFTFITHYSNYDVNLPKLKKTLYKQRIFFEVMSGRVCSRRLFPLSGPNIMILFNNFELLSLIPKQLISKSRFFISNNTVYLYSLFLKAQQFNTSFPLSVTYLCKNNTFPSLLNLNLTIIKNSLYLLQIKHAHC